MKYVLKLSILILLFVGIIKGQNSSFTCDMPDIVDNSSSYNYTGKYISSNGTLKVLVVYIRFAGDNYTSSEWPNIWPNVTGLPDWAAGIVNSSYSASGSYTPGLVSDYFYKNSYGNLHIIGDVYYVTTDSNLAHYESLGFTAGMRAIQNNVFDRLDSPPYNVDFTEYDNWSYNGEWDITPGEDGKLDMAWLITRHVPDNTLLSLGTAQLFVADDFFKDNIEIANGIPSSGITIFKNSTESPINSLLTGKYSSVNIIAHEMSHYLMGGGHLGLIYLGVDDKLSPTRSYSEFRTYCGGWMGEYSGVEKWRLGWLQPKNITTNGDNYFLSDLASTMNEPLGATSGRLFKIDIPNTNPSQYFLIENRRWISDFEPRFSLDNVDHGSLKPGILVYHIVEEKPDVTNYKLQRVDADGRFQWKVVYHGLSLSDKWDDLIDKDIPDPINGYSETEEIFIPGYPSETWFSTWRPNSAMPNGGGAYICTNSSNGTYETSDNTGDSLDLFQVGDVISPWSNPASHWWNSTTFASTNIGIQVLSINPTSQVCTLAIRLSQAQELAPSKPQNLQSAFGQANQVVNTWNANTEPDISYYNIYRQLYYGSTTLSEVKVNSSNITGTTFTDNIVIPANTPSSVNLYVRYKIEAVDNQAKVSVKAIGNSILLGTTSFGSGTITSNTTWSGAVKLITGNLQVNSNATLTINTNTFVCFASTASFQVNGYLNASNASFQGLGSSSWYGMTINGLATSSLTNCTIRDAQYGLIVDGASSATPFVTNCNISASTIGVWIKTYGDPRISNCYIQSSGTAAVLSSNDGRGTISRSKLYGDCQHIHKNDNSATTSYAYNNNGRNILYGTYIPGYGIYVTGGYPVFNNGYNSIPTRGAFPQYYNATGASRDAINNYWGGGSPYISGSVTYTPYLTSLPSPLGPDWTLSKIGSEGGTVSSDDPLALAWKAFGDNDFSKTIEFAKGAFDNNVSSKSADSKLQAEALFLWMKSAMLNGDLLKSESTIKSLNIGTQYAKSANYEAVRWLAKSAVINDEIKKAEEYALSVPVESPYCKEILFDAAVETIERWGSMEKAKSFFDKLGELYPDKETIKEIELVQNLYGSYLDVTGDKVAKPYTESTAATVPVSMNMFDAYPNPFNPTTTIAYSLTEAAKVNIKIYDILGSEVSSLVDDVKEEGYYTASFNASNLASGLYFARITISSNSQAPFVKTIKMVLTK